MRKEKQEKKKKHFANVNAKAKTQNDCFMYIMSCRKINNITLIKENVYSSPSRSELVVANKRMMVDDCTTKIRNSRK